MTTLHGTYMLHKNYVTLNYYMIATLKFPQETLILLVSLLTATLPLIKEILIERHDMKCRVKLRDLYSMCRFFSNIYNKNVEIISFVVKFRFQPSPTAIFV